MTRWYAAILACSIALAALVASATWASAHTWQALGPEGRAYAVEAPEGRYNAQLRRGGRYEDSRGAQGSWSFDGRTVCMIVRPPRGDEYEACVPFRDLAVGQSIVTRGWTPDGSQARVTRVE
jgi:hypothetical protein